MIDPRHLVRGCLALLLVTGLWAAPPPVGAYAPMFSLPTTSGETLNLGDYADRQNVVLSFVPAAFTPVCSEQWPGYNAVLAEFAAREAVLIGITVDNLPSLRAWIESMGGLDFPVLSDFYPHGAVAARYGVLRPDGTAQRALFVIDRAGIIRWVDVHPIEQRPPLEELIAALDALE